MHGKRKPLYVNKLVVLYDYVWLKMVGTCLCKYFVFDIWATTWQNQQNGMCALRKLRSAWASAQFNQGLHCPHEESLGPYLPIERTAKTLIRLGGCEWLSFRRFTSKLSAQADLSLRWAHSHFVGFVRRLISFHARNQRLLSCWLS